MDIDDRKKLIDAICATMPTINDPQLTDEDYNDIVKRGPPRFLYHGTDASRRQSIAEEGLLLSHSETAELAKEMGYPDWQTYGGIFFSTVIHDITPLEDVWVLDTEGWAWTTTEIGAAADELAPDFSVDTAVWAKDEVWWYVRSDVLPNQLKLHELCYPHDQEDLPTPGFR